MTTGADEKSKKARTVKVTVSTTIFLGGPMARKKRGLLKFHLSERFGSLTDAAQAIGIDYFRLSRFISRAVSLEPSELQSIRKKLRIGETQFHEMVR